MQPDLFPGEKPTPIPPSGWFAEVVLDRPLDVAFSYAIPEPLVAAAAIGKRMLVPFGRGDRSMVAHCVGLSQTDPGREVKPILAVLDDQPLLTEPLLRLTRWMADYYLCGWGQVIQAVVPAGARAGAGTRRRCFVELVPAGELREPTPKLPPKQARIVEHLRGLTKPVEVQRLRRQLGVGPGPVRALLERGLLRQVERRVERETAPEEAEPLETPHVLNPDQERVWTALEPALHGSGFRPFLLHGVTGSGKTEIYLRAIDRVLQQGKQALVLVPEISLTPQTVQRFRSRFGQVAVLHSNLTQADRGGQWRRVHDGQARVIVGARSAVFAPACQLGLIVIDEEHETSFKQDSTPRYHARDVAVMRARLEEISILLGSATPSMESWHNVQRGAYTLLSLPQRVLDRPLPPVHLVDMRYQVRKGRPPILGDALLQAMRDTLKREEQIILLLNRRGFATHVHCPSCGHVENCKFCDLALTFHRSRDVLLCHTCGYEQPPVQSCSQCGQHAIRYQGLGTEKLEAEVREKFPGAVVERMDSDTTRRSGSHARLLTAFRKGEIQILLGTQMIAKGLDFPNVTLVGVINADLALHVPDFRSTERTFQLLSQVAGRAGRGPNGGRVLVQTFSPDHPCVAHVVTHDYRGFIEGELRHRQEHGYPPFQRMARIILRGREEEPLRVFSQQVADAFAAGLQHFPAAEADSLRLLGPAEAPIYRIKGYYRHHFQIQAPGPGLLHRLLRVVLPTLPRPAGIELALDIDPFNML